MSDKTLLSYQETAQLLGPRPGTLYAMVSRRQIPHVRLGKRLVRFDRAELDPGKVAGTVPGHRPGWRRDPGKVAGTVPAGGVVCWSGSGQGPRFPTR